MRQISLQDHSTLSVSRAESSDANLDALAPLPDRQSTPVIEKIHALIGTVATDGRHRRFPPVLELAFKRLQRRDG